MSRHHGHIHSLRHRFKRRLKRKKWIVPSVLLVVATLIAGALWMVLSDRAKEQQIISGNQVNVVSGYRDISYQGKQYRYNSRITTILFAGLDADTPLEQSTRYTAAPRADTLSLVVLDEYHHQMTVIALNRSTLTKIRKYTLNGRNRGLFTDFLCYAYTYGDGGEVSCKNLCDAVSNMLYGIPINGYVVTNRSSLPLIGEIIGPVTVTVPNDDLAELDPGYAAGEQITVDADNLETFVRTRDTDIQFSNVGRMERQQAYINAALERIRTLAKKDSSGLWDMAQSAEANMRTNITRSRYLDLVRTLNNTGYNPRDYYTPTGELIMKDKHSAFYPDEEDLLKHVIDIFYIAK